MSQEKDKNIIKAERRVKLIYMFTVLVTLIIGISISVVLFKLIPVYIKDVTELKYGDIFHNSVIISCLFVVLYESWIFMQGMKRISKRALHFGDFYRKAKQQKDALTNLK